MAEVIRRALDQSLAADIVQKRENLRKRALQAAGRFTDSADDVAEHHDQYLAAA
jgi:hypothetical protein